MKNSCLLILCLLACIQAGAEDPRLAERRLLKEQTAQRAGVLRAMSKEMPPELEALPVFAEIEWTEKEMPFIAKGPHGGVSGGGMAVVDGKIYYLGGFIPAGDETEESGNRTSRWAHVYDPRNGVWTRLPDLPSRSEYTRAIATADAVFIIGGYAQGRPGRPLAEVHRLNVSQSPLKWETVVPLNVPRSHTAADRAGSLLIVAGEINMTSRKKATAAKPSRESPKCWTSPALAKIGGWRLPFPALRAAGAPPRCWMADFTC